MGPASLLRGSPAEAWSVVLAVPAVLAIALWRGSLAAMLAVLGCLAWYLHPTLPPSPGADSGALQAGLFTATGVLCAVIGPRWRQRQPGSPRDVVFWLESAAVMALVLPIVLFVAIAMHTRDLAIGESRRRVERLARTAHEHALKVLETDEVLVGRVEDLVAGLSDEQIRQRAASLHVALNRMTAGLPQVHAIRIVDAAGRRMVSSREPQPLVESPVPLRVRLDRDAPEAVFVEPPRRGTRTGQVFFEVTRRREVPGGGPAGLLVVAFNAEYFRGFYAEISPPDSGIAHTLLQRGGAVLARWPASLAPGDTLSAASPIRTAMAEDRPFGTIHSVSTVDGVRRIAAYRRVGHYPVYVHVGLDEEAALTDWRTDTLVLAAFVLPLALVLSLATRAALRRTRQNIAMADQLQHEFIERSRVEAALHHSQKLEALGHLTGGVAHDFNNLLMVVSMNATILAKQAGIDPPPKPLQGIMSAVKAGTKLTRQLVAFTRRQPLVPQAVDFAQRLEADTELLRTLLGSQVELQAQVAPGTPPVLLDPSELELALINLTINAKHAMPDGGTLTLDVREVEGGMVALTVSDTGCGIAPENLQRVFEPFFTTKARGVGTGLGLSQVQGLCVRAGGRVEIVSQPGAGTSVRLLFPALQQAGEPVRAAAPADAMQPLHADILLVEDNPDVAGATAALLRSIGCRVQHCEHPAAALSLLEGGIRFDAVLSDVVMPGQMDGVEFARVLAQRYPALPVLLMTGYADRIPEAEQLQLTVLPKPIDAPLLAAQLRRRLDARAEG
jgi:signal transduction histidine kinase/CheY-like chemotaxis protein